WRNLPLDFQPPHSPLPRPAPGPFPAPFPPLSPSLSALSPPPCPSLSSAPSAALLWSSPWSRSFAPPNDSRSRNLPLFLLGFQRCRPASSLQAAQLNGGPLRRLTTKATFRRPAKSSTLCLLNCRGTVPRSAFSNGSANAIGGR